MATTDPRIASRLQERSIRRWHRASASDKNRHPVKGGGLFYCLKP